MSLKDPRKHDKKHLKFIRQLPCLVCMDSTSTEAAHIRYSDSRAAKVNPGVGQKPHDYWTVPLCGKHHREQHEQNEREFWNEKMIDPLFVAKELYNVTGDHERGLRIINAAQNVLAAG